MELLRQGLVLMPQEQKPDNVLDFKKLQPFKLMER